MECLVCTDVARAWVCAPCAGAEVDRRRGLLHKVELAKARVETEYLRRARVGQAAAADIDQRAARRWKVQQMQAAVLDEQQQVERAHARIAALETFRLDQTKRVDAAYSALRRYTSDMSISPDEFRHLQQQLAVQPPLVLPPAGALSLMRSKRRLQANPLFTRNLARFHGQMTVKLAKCRLRLVDQLLNIYVVKRKSTHSCTIVGLELMDQPDAMFYAARITQQQLIHQHHHPSNTPVAPEQQTRLTQAVLQDQDHPPAYSGPPGTDPEVVSAALGYIVLVLQMLSAYLQVGLPYAMHFAGSQSYLTFNDEEASRYYLTLLDNANPQHFNRAITLLHFNILYFCERVVATIPGPSAQGKMDGTSGSGEATSGGGGGGGGGGGMHIAPMQLLPSMLKLIETIFLHLRFVVNEPTAAITTTTTSTSTHQPPPSLAAPKHLHSSPPSSSSLASRSSAGSSAVLDASLLMSQSMVTVARPAGDPTKLAVARVGVPIHAAGHRSQPRDQRMEAPPFFADSTSAIGSAATAGGEFGALGVGGLGGSPVMPFDSPPTTPTRPSSSPHQDARAFAMRLGPPAHPHPPPIQLQRSDLLTQSQFFGLPPNGYLSAEEPQNSVLMSPSSLPSQRAATAAAATTSAHQQSPRTSTPLAPSGPQLQRAHLSPAAVMAPSTRSSPHAANGAAPTTPRRTSQLTAASASPTALSHQSASPQVPPVPFLSPALFQAPPTRTGGGGVATGGLPPRTPSQGPVPSGSRVVAPAVSYASETDLGWDLVDLVKHERLVGEEEEEE